MSVRRNNKNIINIFIVKVKLRPLSVRTYPLLYSTVRVFLWHQYNSQRLTVLCSCTSSWLFPAVHFISPQPVYPVQNRFACQLDVALTGYFVSACVKLRGNSAPRHYWLIVPISRPWPRCQKVVTAPGENMVQIFCVQP